MEDYTKGIKILMEDERIICLYTLCLSSNTARPLDGVGVPQKAYNSFIFQQNFEALGVIFHPPPQNEKLSSSVKLLKSFDLIQIGLLCDEYWPWRKWSVHRKRSTSPLIIVAHINYFSVGINGYCRNKIYVLFSLLM